MNNDRRKAIDRIKRKIQIKEQELIEITSEIERIKDEEQEYLDNIPENLQNSERYEASEIAIDALEDAIYSLSEIDWESITETLGAAMW